MGWLIVLWLNGYFIGQLHDWLSYDFDS